jgi:hypothetical protein
VKIDRTQSLNQLQLSAPVKPDYGSHVVIECYRLRDVPLSQLTAENLRLLIGQGIALDHLVPMALELVGEQPLVSGDFYAGDLLVVLLSLPASFWQSRRDWCRRLDLIAKPIVERYARSSHHQQDKLAHTFEALKPAYEAFSRVESAPA